VQLQVEWPQQRGVRPEKCAFITTTNINNGDSSNEHATALTAPPHIATAHAHI
jgi:hypothetical protein